MAVKERPDYDFFCDTLAIATELAVLRHDPTALGRLVASLAQVKQENSGSSLTSERQPAEVIGGA